MAVKEPETPAEMEALRKRPELMELLLQQRAEQGHRWALIHNLLYQGKHDEARQVAALPEQQGHIDLHEAAVENPDDEWCACEHVSTVLQPLKHQILGKSWSEKHGGIVTHYRCQYCGHRNATPAPPDDSHDKIELLRAQAQARLNATFDRSKRSTVQDAIRARGIDDDGAVRALAQHPDE